MFQFYFLSIILNVFIGFVLFFSDSQKTSELTVYNQNNDDEKNKADGKKSFIEKLENLFGKDSFLDSFVLYVISGIVSCFVGLVKLLQAVNGIALFGDLLPACAGLIGGSSILIFAFEKKSSLNIEINETLSFILIQCRKYVGAGCLIVSILHFLIPGALFL